MNRKRSRTHATIAKYVVRKQLKSNETQAETPGQYMVFALAWRRPVLVRRPPVLP